MPSSESPSSASGIFPDTPWTVLHLAGSGNEAEAASARERLCRRYWFPVYAFIRHQGRSHHDAEDGTQEFFSHLLRNEGLTHVRRSKGHFRSFLLTALRHFLINEWRDASTAKRGGTLACLSLDSADASERYAGQLIDPDRSPEEVFDHHWALTVVAEATRELEEEFTKRGHLELFETLRPLLLGDTRGTSLSVPAARLGVKRHTLAAALHRTRLRLGQRLRAAVAQTVSDPAEVEAEIQHLIASLG